MMLPPLMRISPSSAILIVQPARGRPTDPILRCGIGVDGRAGSRLGEPVALQNRHADSVVEMAEPLTESSRA